MPNRIDCYLHNTRYLKPCNAMAEELSHYIPLTAIEFDDRDNPLVMSIKAWVLVDGVSYSTVGSYLVADLARAPLAVAQYVAVAVFKLFPEHVRH